MLDDNLKAQLKAYLERVTLPFEIEASLNDSESSAQLKQLLQDMGYFQTVDVDTQPGSAPDRVIVTTGSSGGFILTFLSTLGAGQRIGIPSPGYPAYRSILAALDLVPAPMVLRAEDRFAPTAALLRETHARAPVAHFANASASPPHQIASLPDAAPLGAPLTGASIMAMPFLASSSASARAANGSMVAMQITM